jgi:hypothetical protein
MRAGFAPAQPKAQTGQTQHRALERTCRAGMFYLGAASVTRLCTRYIRANATSVITITT